MVTAEPSPETVMLPSVVGRWAEKSTLMLTPRRIQSSGCGGRLSLVPRSGRPQARGVTEPPKRRQIYRGWWVVGALAFASFGQVAFFNPVLGIFIEPLEQEFGWSRGAIAGALSVGTVIGAFSSPFIGRFIDRHGGRPFIVVGLCIVVVCLLLLSQVQHIWQFYVLYAVGRALTMGILNLAILVTIANWFIRDRGRATAVNLVGTRSGMALMPLVVLLFVTVANWRVAFLALGVMVAVLSIGPAWKFVRRRPEDFGLLPDGRGELAGEDESADGLETIDVNWSVRDALRTRAYWLLLTGTSQIVLVGGAVNLSMAPHLQDSGVSRATAVSAITVWAIFGIVGGILGGELRQRLSVRVALPMMMFLTATALIWLTLVENTWMAYTFAVYHGLLFGAQLPLNQTVFADYFGRWSVGAIQGIAAPIQFGMNAVGPVLASYVFDQTGMYDEIFMVFVGLYVFGAVVILLAARPRH